MEEQSEIFFFFFFGNDRLKVNIKHSRSGAHPGTCGRVADARGAILFLIDDTDKMPKIPIMLDDLVGDPLSTLDSLWTCNQGHKITLHDVLGMCRIHPGWQWAGEVVGVEDVIAGGRHDDTY